MPAPEVVVFDLGKVRINSQIESNRRHEAVLCRDAKFKANRLIFEYTAIKQVRIRRPPLRGQRADSLSSF